ncbi:Aste57867_14429 [Aphanomyces stellatus]|uniref:Aste57867_14429 protein n=1 Tax=Aphanomyces stellatus TaxID=120398 RepID=A0A485L2B9_9STRA|nr:hypothetical protein As57867_014375 [Aphanomyces stellatus]VFT91251.1 Aste57867_14429 [Aphanomyces stellatus]
MAEQIARLPRASKKNEPPALRCLPNTLARSRTLSFVFARLLHLVIAIHLIVWALISSFLTIVEAQVLRIHNPRLSSIALSTVGLLHLYGACKRATSSSRRLISTISVVPVRPPWQPQRSTFALVADFLNAHQDVLTALFNLCEVASQSVRVVELAERFVDASSLIGYASCVIAYAAVSPWILFVRNTTKKDLLVNSLDCLFSFALSCGLFLHMTLFEILPYAFSINRVPGQDNVWNTRSINLTRILVITSPVDYVCQVCMHLGTFISLRRVMHSLGCLPSHPSNATSTKKETPTVHLSHSKLIHRVLVANGIINCTWACVLSSLLIRAVAFREPCPAYCPIIVRPIFDLRCNCAYVYINCHTLATETPEMLLEPATVGTRTLILQFARCDLPLGLNTSTMAPHTNLYKIVIVFSNMTRWDATLPPSVRNINIRFARLTALPTIVTTNVPSYFGVLYIDSCPLRSLPTHAFDQLPSLQRLWLTNISLATFPDTITNLPLLFDLNLRDNDLTTVTMTWQTHTAETNTLRSVRFNGNQLEAGPWAMVRKGLVVELSSNPIASVDEGINTALQLGQVVLDDTPYCKSFDGVRSWCITSLCADGCYAYMQGDHFCDPVCFTSACAFDGGDCDEMGFN